MKIKVAEAKGIVLDWMVARAEGYAVYHNEYLNGWKMPGFWISGYFPRDGNAWVYLSAYSPSTDWSIAGPIIEREGIGLLAPKQSPCGLWHASLLHPDISEWTGPTPLIAAMRCFCASRLGEEVDVPEKLL